MARYCEATSHYLSQCLLNTFLIPNDFNNVSVCVAGSNGQLALNEAFVRPLECILYHTEIVCDIESVLLTWRVNCFMTLRNFIQMKTWLEGLVVPFIYKHFGQYAKNNSDNKLQAIKSVDYMECSVHWHGNVVIMIASSNGIIFRVTGHLCGEFTGHRWIPRTKASDAELWCFLWSASE